MPSLLRKVYRLASKVIIVSQMNNPFSINEEVFNQLYENYDDAIYYVNHPSYTREANEVVPQLVSKAQFRSFVETAFWASLKHEEGRFHQFSLALLPPEAPHAPFVFEQPVELNAHELAKLAPALNPQDYYIGVWVDGDERLSMWGFAAIDDMGLSGVNLSAMTVAPGEIIVSFNEYRLCHFSTLITGTRSESVGSSKYLEWLVPEIKTKRIRELGLSVMMPAVDYGTVATAMNAHRHGGTLLIVPNDDGWRDSVRQPIKFVGSPFIRARHNTRRRDQIYAERKKAGDMMPTESESYKMAKVTAEKSLKGVGGLTAVDGATVITYELDVLAFGVKIRPKLEESRPESVLITEPYKGAEIRKVDLSNLGGTRHQSAAQFAFDQREALVFVASQDGRMSVMKWSPEEKMVSVIRPAEYGLL